MRTDHIPKPVTSPDGRIQVEFLVEDELQISQWLRTRRIANPRVTDTSTGRILLDLWDSDWDADIEWPDYATLRLDLYIWDLRRSFVVLINAEYQSYCVLDKDGVWRPLACAECPVEDALQQALDCRLKRPAGSGLTKPALIPPPHPKMLKVQ
jgi:hypothetical protein